MDKDVVIIKENLFNWNFENPEKPRSMRYNRYQHFSKFIHEMYPNAKKILEVGCGSGYLSSLLTNLGYNVTAMDSVKYNDLEKKGIKFYERTFTLDTDIQEYDLVVGLHYCDATEKIIRNCIKNDKEFAVVICETQQGMSDKIIENRKQYINYLKSISEYLKITDLPIYEVLMKRHWGETIYYKKEAKVKCK